jgi:hypothetical protein
MSNVELTSTLIDGVGGDPTARAAAAVAQGQLSNLLTAPGGAGDGTTDDTTAISAANAAKGYVLLPYGKTYRIRSNLSIGIIYSQGGYLLIDSGVTLTFDGVVGHDAQVIFKGAGIAKSSDNNYSTGWFDGASFDLKWDFNRRAFQTNAKKSIVWPIPLAGDPAGVIRNGSVADLSTSGSRCWSCAAPVIFDDPENNCDIIQRAPLYGATRGMTCVIEFSPVNKTEDIFFRNGLWIDAGDNADDCINAHGGARIHVVGYARLDSPRRDSVRLSNDILASGFFDEIKMDFVSANNFGRAAIFMEGVGSFPKHNGANFEYLFTNGARGIYATATVTAGAITALTIPSANPINSVTQTLTGYGYSGQSFYIVSAAKADGQGTPGAGYGATGTPVVDGSGNLTGITITNGGSGFVNGEVVVVTSAISTLYCKGLLRSVRLGRLFEYKGSTNNLTVPSVANVVLESNSAGATQQSDFGPIVSGTGNRPALVSRDGSSGTAPEKHRYSVRGWQVPNPCYDGDNGQLRLDWIDDVNVTEPPSSVPSPHNNMIFSTVSVSNLKMSGIPRERVVGNSDGFYFDGQQVLYSTALANNSVASMNIKPFSSMIGLFRISLVTNTDNVLYDGLLRGDTNWYDVLKGSLVDTSLVSLSGTTGTSGRVTISINSGRLYIENRSGASLRYKMVVSK